MNEFELINNLKLKYGLNKIGDDCAVLPKDAETDLLVTSDMLVEDVDFELVWTKPELLGHKALAVSLSDIAAMGGTPKWAMLSIGVPESLWNSDFIDKFYASWFELARSYDVELVGGDISRSPDKLFVDSIAGGEVAKGKAILRSTAKPGDAIFVTGTIGGAAGGLKLLERGFEIIDGVPDLTAVLLLKQLKPSSQTEVAKALQELRVVTSMIDISDGLSSDLGHICRASGVGAVLRAETLPIHRDLYNYFHSDLNLEMALDGGEDFELLFTVDEKNISLLDSLDVTRIGEITSNVDIITLISEGNSTVLEPKGYKHF